MVGAGLKPARVVGRSGRGKAIALVAPPVDGRLRAWLPLPPGRVWSRLRPPGQGSCMKVMWCWRCKMELPMLDEEEFAQFEAAHRECRSLKRYRERYPEDERVD